MCFTSHTEVVLWWSLMSELLYGLLSCCLHFVLAQSVCVYIYITSPVSATLVSLVLAHSISLTSPISVTLVLLVLASCLCHPGLTGTGLPYWYWPPVCHPGLTGTGILSLSPWSHWHRHPVSVTLVSLVQASRLCHPGLTGIGLLFRSPWSHWY